MIRAGADAFGRSARSAVARRTTAPAQRRDKRSRRGPESGAASTETPRGKSWHAVLAHVAQSHGGWVLHAKK
jgi:hypothetical protein